MIFLVVALGHRTPTLTLRCSLVSSQVSFNTAGVDEIIGASDELSSTG